MTMTGRIAHHGADPMFLDRWSPRAFTGEAMPQPVLETLFEAAGWAPSAFNGQPWRFVYAHRDTPGWDPLFGALIPYNQAWVKNASVLMYVVSDRFRRREGAEPSPNPWHAFDSGAAWGYLALQAHRLGWAAHGMAGFDKAKAFEAVGADPDQFNVEAAVAVGKVADPAILDEPYRSREVPSQRNPVSSFAFEGRLKA
jgi:nitroreductase